MPARLRTALAAAVLATGMPVAVPALAQAGAGGPVARPDPFGDAAIARSAAADDAGKRFGKLDANRDGALSLEELAAGRPVAARAGSPAGEKQERGGRRGSFMFNRMDANHDGKLSRDEFVAGMLVRFDRMDTNRDGQLTRAERQTAMETMRQRMMERAAQGGMSGAMGADGEGPSSRGD